MSESRHCAKCGQVVSRWQYIGFFRLGSISCPKCRGLVTLDRRGWWAFRGIFLGSVALCIVAAGFKAPELATIVIVAGVAVAILAAAQVGRLIASSESGGD